MKRDNPFIGMTPEELNDYLDDLKKEKPGKDDSPMISDFMFKRNAPIGKRFSMDGKEGEKVGQRCSACDTFYFDSENMINESGVCENCRKDLEVLEKEEKKSKCF